VKWVDASIYKSRVIQHVERAFGETFIPRASQPRKRKLNIMGDKSPKANQKKSGQKNSQAKNVAAKKKAAVASKQAAGKKK
jgi:hypothetical protein